jgi:hypothetical protein
MHARAASLRVVVLPHTRPLLISLGSVGAPLVLSFRRRVLGSPASGVLVSVTGMLDQLALRLLKPFRLSLAGLDERSIGLVW